MSPIKMFRNERKVLVMVGIDGASPPTDVSIATRDNVNRKVNRQLGFSPSEHTAVLTLEDNPTPEQRDLLGDASLHVQQYEVNTQKAEVGSELVKSIEIEVVTSLNELGYNTLDTHTTVI